MLRQSNFSFAIRNKISKKAFQKNQKTIIRILETIENIIEMLEMLEMVRGKA